MVSGVYTGGFRSLYWWFQEFILVVSGVNAGGLVGAGRPSGLLGSMGRGAMGSCGSWSPAPQWCLVGPRQAPVEFMLVLVVAGLVGIQWQVSQKI